MQTYKLGVPPRRWRMIFINERTRVSLMSKARAPKDADSAVHKPEPTPAKPVKLSVGKAVDVVAATIRPEKKPSIFLFILMVLALLSTAALAGVLVVRNYFQAPPEQVYLPAAQAPLPSPILPLPDPQAEAAQLRGQILAEYAACGDRDTCSGSYVCHLEHERCVECVTDNDCRQVARSGGRYQYCDQVNFRCQQCVTDSQCSAPFTRCVGALSYTDKDGEFVLPDHCKLPAGEQPESCEAYRSNACKECVGDSDCPVGKVCTSYRCLLTR